uniref:Uncharacterized protein n=1 Tax=Anguilla anguilla TaxID=7936 RepID=A0A0E9UKD1_ANGAN
MVRLLQLESTYKKILKIWSLI